LAALAAEAGLTAPQEMLEGPVGFGAAMGGGVPVDWSRVFDSWNDPPTVSLVTVKIHSCCGHAFAPIDAALALRSQLASAEMIAAIEVETYSTAVEVAGEACPRTPFEARFSVAFGVASALCFGSVGLAAFTAERLADPRVQQLMSRTSVRGTEEFDRLFPQKRGARVSLRLHDGRRLIHLQDTRRGGPEYPISEPELEMKFRELVEPTFGAEAAAILARLKSSAARSLTYTR
jgi:2-methylcitrate dehydratase PrpD